MRFERLSDAGDRAAGPCAGNENVHGSFRIRPYLFAGSTAVHGRIGGIGKLTEDNCTRNGFLQLPSTCNSTFHPFGAGCQFELGTVRFQQVAPLHGHRIRHGEYDAVAFDGTYPCQPNTGIAARRLDDGGAGMQESALFGIGDHRQRDPVFDAAAGVEELYFYCQTGLETLQSGDFKNGCVSYEIREVMYHVMCFCTFVII